MLSHLFVTAFSPQNTIIKTQVFIMPDVGTLQVSLVSNRGKRPITDAAVEISSAGNRIKY